MAGTEARLPSFFDPKISPGALIAERNGYYSPDLNVWFDPRINSVYDSLGAPQQELMRFMSEAALGIGQAHLAQTRDANSRVMWPKELFEAGGAEKLITAVAKAKHWYYQPYSLLSNGLYNDVRPFSKEYEVELAPVARAFERALGASKTSGVLEDSFQREYFNRLFAIYGSTSKADTYIAYMKGLDSAWVKQSPSNSFLVIAEPTEDTEDPLKSVLEADPMVRKWVQKCISDNGISPWRKFFEFSLLFKNNDDLSPEEAGKVWQKAFRLYGSGTEPKMSVEFRDLLLSAGHRASTGITLPNFKDIRLQWGIKVVISPNMVETSIKDEIGPELQKQFPSYDFNHPLLFGFLRRGRNLGVLGRQVNSPLGSSLLDSSLDILKADTHGQRTVILSGAALGDDSLSMFVSEIGMCLSIHRQMLEAERIGDQRTIQEFSAQHRAAQLWMSSILQSGGLVVGDNGKVNDINLSAILEGVTNVNKLLDQVQDGTMDSKGVAEKLNIDPWQFFEFK